MTCAEGSAEHCNLLLPRSDYRIVPNWDVMGLRATGSNDIVVEDAFVPTHRTLLDIDMFNLKCPGGGHISRRRTGALLGVGNGDSSCQESDKQPQRSLFNGLAQVILQSSKTPGMIIVEAYTEDSPGPTLPLTRLSITTRKVPLRPAAS